MHGPVGGGGGVVLGTGEVVAVDGGPAGASLIIIVMKNNLWHFVDICYVFCSLHSPGCTI